MARSKTNNADVLKFFNDKKEARAKGVYMDQGGEPAQEKKKSLVEKFQETPMYAAHVGRYAKRKKKQAERRSDRRQRAAGRKSERWQKQSKREGESMKKDYHTAENKRKRKKKTRNIKNTITGNTSAQVGSKNQKEKTPKKRKKCKKGTCSLVD